MPLSRRALLAAPALLVLPRPARAAGEIGVTVRAQGSGALIRAGGSLALQPDVPLYEGDTVRTAADSFAELMLITATRINLGPDSAIVLDRYTADLGGEITIGGAMAFDRSEDLAPVDLTFRTAFAQIGVRGTRFFAGQIRRNRGALATVSPFAVFAERGRVEVSRQGETRTLGPGDGVQVETTKASLRRGLALQTASPPLRLGAVVRWREEKIAAAFATVGL